MEDEENPLIKQIDTALDRYYNLQNVEYKNEDGIGFFEAYCTDNGLDDDATIEEELEQNDPDECLLIDFDQDFPGVANDENRGRNIFRILQKCAEDETVYREKDARYTALQIKQIDWKISERDINLIIKIHKEQCPKVFDDKFESNQSLLKLLCVGKNIDKPYLQWLADMYQRERVETKDKLISYGPAVWALSNKHCVELKKWKDNNTFPFQRNILDKSPLDDTRIAITSYFHRISPEIIFLPPRIIIDSLSQTCEYIAASIYFVANLAKETNKTCPFQFDVTMAFNKTKKGTTPYQPKKTTLDTDSSSYSDDDEDTKKLKKKKKKKDIFFDVFGNVKNKLETEKLLYISTEVIDEKKDNSNEATGTKAARIFNEEFNKFKNNKIKQKYKDIEFEDYPQRHRFCAFIDRREANEEDNKDKDILTNDEVIFYEPPNNCNSFPKHGKHMALFYFNTLATCIIPNKGYNNGLNANKNNVYETDQKQKVLNETITCHSSCNGAILVLSFHVESIDEIRCYLYMNGQVLRFFPNDILTVLPEFFDKSFADNQQYAESKQAKLLVKNMNKKLKDIQFEAFVTKYKATVDEINAAKGRYTKFILY